MACCFRRSLSLRLVKLKSRRAPLADASTRKNRIEALGVLAKAAGVTLPRIRREQTVEREFTIVMPGEDERLMNLATNDRDLLVLGLLYYCGLRVCELTGLQRRDFKNEELHITRSAVMSKGAVIVKPRTKTRRARSVPVPRKWLRDMIRSAPPGFLIHQPGAPDMPVSDRTVHHLVTRRTAGTEFEGLCPLALRHSAATAYALSGVPLEAAAAMMGHSTQMLSKIYARYRPDVRMELSRKAFGGD